jgi:polyisoprenoid-binding protein YceI
MLMATWNFDPMHTQVEFSAKHLGMMSVRGNFTEVQATGQVYPDDPERSSVEVTINSASIQTHNQQRDNDLRGANLLDVEHFPTITFKSTKIKKESEERGTMTGDLTIKGVTRPVTLKLVKYGEFRDPQMGHRIGYAAETKINRKDFGIQFDYVLDGRLVVSNEIQISIEGEILEVEAKEPARTTA